jgi:hypothetical protein
MEWKDAHEIVNQSEKEAAAFEGKINDLIKDFIQEFKTKYPEPCFKITEGDSYKIRYDAFTTLLAEQSQNS